MCAIDEQRLREILEGFETGRLDADQVVAELRVLPYEDLGFAKVDHHRALRKGFPEVIFGMGKSPEDIATLAAAVLERSERLLITKASPEAFSAVVREIPDAVHDEIAQTIVADRRDTPIQVPGLVVVSAGTSDEPVAREAAVTAELMGCRVERFNDVGVAGIHRLFDVLPAIQEARVLVVVAGMEGALPSVVGGLVRAPVIAVPTSVGYGTGLGGIAPLLAMLNSCAPGITVVNIDNGFGAGYFAALILNGGAGP